MLLIFAGLPGVGKTTLSQSVAERISATYLRIDRIEDAIAASSLKIHSVEEAGYLVGYAIAEDNLKNRRTVVADSVNPIELTRSAWLQVAVRAECKAVEIEIVCTDRAEHKRRVEQRYANFPKERWPTWQAVVDRDYDTWTRDRLVVDTVEVSVRDCVDKIVRKLSLEGT